jgi:hypothetical protein
MGLAQTWERTTIDGCDVGRIYRRLFCRRGVAEEAATASVLRQLMPGEQGDKGWGGRCKVRYKRSAE